MSRKLKVAKTVVRLVGARRAAKTVRYAVDLRRGRMQRTLSAATAASALPLGLEIYFEHYKGSYGD